MGLCGMHPAQALVPYTGCRSNDAVSRGWTDSLENLGQGHPKDHARPLVWTVLNIPVLDVSNRDCSLVLLISSLPLVLLCQNFIQTN